MLFRSVLYIVAPSKCNPNAKSAKLWDCECLQCKAHIKRTGKHLKQGRSKCSSYTCRNRPTVPIVKPPAPIVKPPIMISLTAPIIDLPSSSERRLLRERKAWHSLLIRYWNDSNDLRSLEELHEAGVDRINMQGPINLEDIKVNRELSRSEERRVGKEC